MYTIIMNSDKSLSKTVVRTLHQGENLVDNFRFFIPRKYGNLDLSEFRATLKYINQANILHSEKLVLASEQTKDDMLCYYLPVETALTQFAGDITVRLMLKKDAFVLHSSETTVSVVAVSPCYQYSTDEDTSDDSSSDSPQNPSDSNDKEGFEVVEF